MHKLKITVERIDGYCSQPHLVGDSFTIEKGMIRIPEGKHICMWALQSMMPLFPMFQRIEFKEGDWVSKEDQQIVCPDPKGLVHFRIERMKDAC